MVAEGGESVAGRRRTCDTNPVRTCGAKGVVAEAGGDGGRGVAGEGPDPQREVPPARPGPARGPVV